MTEVVPKLEDANSDGRKSRRRRIALLIAISVPLLAAVLLSPPIPQPAEYHDFTDQRRLGNCPELSWGIKGRRFSSLVLWENRANL